MTVNKESRKEAFKRWMVEYEHKKHNTAYQYMLSIDKISRHYSRESGENIDIYEITDPKKIQYIKDLYTQDGIYSEFGETGNATIRSAISTYYRYACMLDNETCRPTHAQPAGPTHTRIDINPEIEGAIINYLEKWRSAKSLPTSEYYKYYEKMPDIILQNENGEILVVMIESEEADYTKAGELAMHMGILQKAHPEMELHGVLIAKSFNESTILALSNIENTSNMTYKINVTLTPAS